MTDGAADRVRRGRVAYAPVPRGTGASPLWTPPERPYRYAGPDAEPSPREITARLHEQLGIQEEDSGAHDPTCPVEAVTASGYHLCTRLIGHSGPHSWPYPETAEASHG